MEKFKISWKFFLVGIWLLFTLALTTWWMIFGLKQIDLLQGLHHELSDMLLSKQRMLMWEGAILLLSLVAGAIALGYHISKERREYQKVKEFFAAFTHDLKTAITSLRLQTDSLREEVKDVSTHKLFRRLLNDTVRLDLQLENSLFLTNLEQSALLLQSIKFSEVVEALKFHWPEFRIILEGDCSVQVDRRVFEVVLKNLIQNAMIHGHADEVRMIVVTSKDQQEKKVKILVKDNGSGFRGDLAQLGKAFLRHTHQSGSGLGLYLCKLLMSRLNGQMNFQSPVGEGFGVVLTLPKGNS